MPQKSILEFEESSLIDPSDRTIIKTRQEKRVLASVNTAPVTAKELDEAQILRDIKRFKARTKLKADRAERRRNRQDRIPQFFKKLTDPIVEPLRPENAFDRHIYSRKELFHYWAFWTIGASFCGCGVGIVSFFKRRNYRRWVLSQPKDVQLKILAENTILTSEQVSIPRAKMMASEVTTDTTNASIASSKYIQSRHSNLPKAMDTRPVLPYAGDWRPSQWFEFGPLRFLNQYSSYPWASELMVEMGKWAARLALMTGVILGAECSIIGLLHYQLGSNIAIRGISGAVGGWMISRIASEGRLYYYQSLYLAIGMGAALAILTFYQSDWAEIAKNNYTIVSMHVPMFDNAYKRRAAAERELEQLQLKHVKDRSEALAEQLEANPELYETLSAEDKLFAYIDWKEYARYKNITLDDDIDVMPYEKRKEMQKKSSGNHLGVNYNSWPFKYFRKEMPQWHLLNSDNMADLSSTTQELETAKNLTKMSDMDSVGNLTTGNTSVRNNDNDATVSPILLS